MPQPNKIHVMWTASTSSLIALLDLTETQSKISNHYGLNRSATAKTASESIRIAAVDRDGSKSRWPNSLIQFSQKDVCICKERKREIPSFQATRSRWLPLRRRRLSVLRSVGRRISLRWISLRRRIALWWISRWRISVLCIRFLWITYSCIQKPKSKYKLKHTDLNWSSPPKFSSDLGKKKCGWPWDGGTPTGGCCWL